MWLAYRAQQIQPQAKGMIYGSPGRQTCRRTCNLVLTEIKAATSRTKLAHETEVAFLKNLKMYIRKILSGYKK